MKRFGRKTPKVEPIGGTALETFGIGLLVADSRGNFVGANRRFREITGYTDEELQQIDWKAIASRGGVYTSAPGRRAPFGPLLAGSSQTKYGKADGEKVWVRMIAYILPEKVPRPGDLVVLVENVSDRRVAEEGERRRVARELHDTAGQTLSALMATLDLIAKRPEMHTECRNLMVECLDLAKLTDRNIRTLSFLLYPPEMDNLGFSTVIRQYVERFTARTGIQTKLQIPKKMPALSRQATSALFHVVLESLNNIWRHSGSAKATIRIGVSGEDLRLRIRDFGPGEKSRARKQPSAPDSTGLGIRGMHDRMRELGGDLDVRFGNKGTLVTARLPIC